MPPSTISAGAATTRSVGQFLAVHCAAGEPLQLRVAARACAVWPDPASRHCSAGPSSTIASGGGGGGRLACGVPRSGVDLSELIGPLGVRSPGCGVGGVCGTGAAALGGAALSEAGGSECGPEAPVSCARTDLSCASSSSMDWKRSSRAFARQRSTICSSSGEMEPSSRISDGGTGSSCRCLRMMSTGAGAVKGTWAVSMWYSKTPSE